MFDTINGIFLTKKHRLPLITLPIVSTIPRKMAFQNTVGKGENASKNFSSTCLTLFFFFFHLSKLYLVCYLQIFSN